MRVTLRSGNSDYTVGSVMVFADHTFGNGSNLVVGVGGDDASMSLTRLVSSIKTDRVFLLVNEIQSRRA